MGSDPSNKQFQFWNSLLGCFRRIGGINNGKKRFSSSESRNYLMSFICSNWNGANLCTRILRDIIITRNTLCGVAVEGMSLISTRK